MGMFPSLSAGASVAIGILVGLCSTCIQSLGLTLQRKSHMLEDERLPSDEPRRPAYRRRRWQIGMLLFLMANIIGSTIQITTLPLPLLSTLQASGLVFNSLLASLLLKEAWTWRTGYGTMLVAAGAVLISLFSALPEPSHSLRQLIELLGHRGFLVWFILSLVLVVALLVLDLVLRKFVPHGNRESPRIQLVRGILAAHALLLAKSAVELIVRSVTDSRNEFRGYQSWLLILAFLVLALSQLYYLHLGLRLISTSVLYPFVFCIYNIVAILDGLIYFRQMDRLPPLHAGLIALGTVILLAGVLALSWRLQEEDEGDEEHRTQMAQHDIPQTVLTPGLGFLGDLDSDENESAVADEEDDLDADEVDPLLSRSNKRTRTSRSTHTSLGKKRKRAATLKEVISIWEELGDGGDEESAYGTFNGNGDLDHRPRSAGHTCQTRRRRDSAGQTLETGGGVHDDTDGGEIGVEAGVRRAKTVPTQRRSRSGRRRSTHGGGSGALFQDLLSRDWWRMRRKSDGDGPSSGEGAV
ncbi:hypothetical protein LTR91_017165 [Friedmanniomyces endolithicus]|uniref:Uncharacterized protein n=1 Tax=Friedmanniomyces endolithicus TaxID=329885 RepID=A0AAN6F4G8_9PEZI|nr:hypothetical protein LTS09_007431 [Friedmanniomyces endolithicus]KAK0304112.1 hypothetical protein LTR82_017326 [Friedmanniomyces endolithicus]KAK0308423.1 hypothetical protein LTR01_005050 [Friedmanniomyces endolithicus]KAK0829346.1 hypothetical protein LTR73_004290 [Friedmanniomyces endolithicus]KAK0910416.1 hypothetical protein LTR57_015857 [Friedmanniomyces endolithicus]